MAQGSYFKEKCMLMAEKKTLTDMLYKFQDQLNRLKASDKWKIEKGNLSFF